MAYATTYPGLLADILLRADDYSDDLMANLDTIIAKAETQLLRDLDLENFQKETAIGNTVANVRTLAVPASVLKINGLWLVQGGSRVYRQKRNKDYCEDYGSDATIKEFPTYWCYQDDSTILFVNTPDQAYAAITFGIVRPAGLSAAVPTTWLSLNAGDLLLQQCFVSAESYLIDTAQSQVLKTDYQALLVSAKLELRGLARSDAQMPRQSGAGGGTIL